MKVVKSHGGVYNQLNGKLKASRYANKTVKQQMKRLEARVKRVEDAGKDYLVWQETERRNKQSLVNFTAASEAKLVGNDQNAQPKYEEYSGLTDAAKLRKLLKTKHVN